MFVFSSTTRVACGQAARGFQGDGRFRSGGLFVARTQAAPRASECEAALPAQGRAGVAAALLRAPTATTMIPRLGIDPVAKGLVPGTHGAMRSGCAPTALPFDFMRVMLPSAAAGRAVNESRSSRLAQKY